MKNNEGKRSRNFLFVCHVIASHTKVETMYPKVCGGYTPIIEIMVKK